MYEALLVIFLIVSISLVIVIMIQQGKGSNIGSSFNPSDSRNLLGSSGINSFITRITIGLAALFFILSLTLGNISSQHGKNIKNSNDFKKPIQEKQKPYNEINRTKNYIPQ